MSGTNALETGDLVWAKMKGHPSWPAIIVNPPRSISHIPCKRYVLFFGDCDSAWIPDKQIMPFEENFEKFSNIKKTKFETALKAVEKFKNFFSEVEKDNSNKKADLGVRKRMLKKFSNLCKKERQQVSLNKKMKKESGATEKEESLTCTHSELKNGCGDNAMKEENNDVTHDDSDASDVTDTPILFQDDDEQYVPIHYVPSELERNVREEVESREIFLPAGDGPSTSSETFGIKYGRGGLFRNKCTDHSVPITRNFALQNGKEACLPAGDGPSTSSETFGTDYHDAQRSFLERLELRNTPSAPRVFQKPKDIPDMSTLINLPKNDNAKISKVQGKSDKIIKRKTPNRRKGSSTIENLQKPATRQRLADILKNNQEHGDSSSSNEGTRHFVPMNAADVPAEIKKLVRSKIESSISPNVNFAGIFDLTNLFSGPVAPSAPRTEIQIIPDITRKTVRQAYAMSKKNKFDYGDPNENLFEAHDPLHYPVVLQRIVRQKPGEVLSSDELWKGLTKPFKLKIGFIGIGAMGYGIVKGLLQFGHYVTIWNRTPKKPQCDEALRNGAIWAESPTDVVLQSDVIFCCVSSCSASYEIFYGENGILHGFKESIDQKSYVELSTIDPSLSVAFARDIEEAGGRYLEAPILGDGCYEERALFIVCAGDQYARTELMDCLCCTGARIFNVSRTVGNALRFKSVYVSVFSGAVMPMAENVNLLKALGFGHHYLMDVLEETPRFCPAINDKLVDLLF